MLNSIEASEVSEVYRRCQQLNLLDVEDTAVVFYNLELLGERLDHLQTVFPDNVRHSIAVKTNPERGILKYIIDQGFGLEAASVEELRLALDCGLPPHKAVFDSPAKTQKEISWCEAHCAGMVVNVNCLEELDRYSSSSQLRIGLRINPELEIDAPEIYNVSGAASKFGVPLSHRSEILKHAVQSPLIRGLHIHAGSEVQDFSPNIRALSALMELAQEINDLRREQGIGQQIEFIDIGGGMQSYWDDEGTNIGLTPFAQALQRDCPQLFEHFEVITEYGRFVHTDNAFAVSNVEYVLPPIDASPKTAILHIGADMFLRQVYSNSKTAYPLIVMNNEGALKKPGKMERYHLAGPLCFAGDYLFRNRELTALQSGDKLAIANVGANTTALWSRHCSRDVPKLVLYEWRADKYFIGHPRLATAGL